LRPATPPATRTPFAIRRPLAALLLLGALAGCSPPAFMSFPPQARGNRLDGDQLAQLVPGTTTRADVVALAGTPTMRATFDDNTWLYISEVTKPLIGGTNDVLGQEVVALTFDAKGVLQKVDRKSAKDGYDVGMVSRATPAPGSEASFLQQLLGNVGRFTPGNLGGGSGGASGLTTTGSSQSSND
jgi:outer membrane protein assembly factor BamE (lipoprotein component of BamABCDE complex)